MWGPHLVDVGAVGQQVHEQGVARPGVHAQSMHELLQGHQDLHAQQCMTLSPLPGLWQQLHEPGCKGLHAVPQAVDDGVDQVEHLYSGQHWCQSGACHGGFPSVHGM